MSTVLSAWNIIGDEGRHETGWHLRRIHSEQPSELFAGLRQPGNVKGLILEVPVDTVPADITLPQSRGFSVETQLYGPGFHRKVRFSLVLSDRSYENVFAVLCDDVAEAAASAESPRAALREWVGQLQVWQSFLAKHGAEGLSDAAVLGLVGELMILRDKLIPCLGSDTAVYSWVGPRGEPNDFEFVGGYLEIKTTATQAPKYFQISNLEQLNDARGLLVLANVRLRPDDGGTSLPQLIGQLREQFGGAGSLTLRVFNAALMAAGYVDAHAHLYVDRWMLRDLHYYRVERDFPRLTRHGVPNGVRDAVYSISVADCARYLVGPDILDLLLRSHADGG